MATFIVSSASRHDEIGEDAVAIRRTDRLLIGKTSTLFLGRRLARGEPNSGEDGEQTDNEIDSDRFAQCERANGRGKHRIDRHRDGGPRRRRALEREHPKEKGGGATEHAQVNYRDPLWT